MSQRIPSIQKTHLVQELADRRSGAAGRLVNRSIDEFISVSSAGFAATGFQVILDMASNDGGVIGGIATARPLAVEELLVKMEQEVAFGRVDGAALGANNAWWSRWRWAAHGSRRVLRDDAGRAGADATVR